MKRSISLLLMLIFIALSGCAVGGAVFYEVAAIAVDERKIGVLLSDEGIEAKIEDAFLNDEVANLRSISPFCFNGCVYLVGEYATKQDKEKAITVARDVEGVKSVEAYLLPKANDDHCTRINNLALVARVKTKLIGDNDTSVIRIRVKSVQCRVVLLGIAGSQKEIDEAISDVKATEGVREVVSFLKSSH
jgi:hyperosmotically inducible periplasmic protein